MKRFLSTILFILIMNLCLIYAVSSAQNEALCNKFLRVHVIANSDSPHDQGVKIAVRDYIFNKHETEFASFKTKDDAIKYVIDNSAELENEINNYLDYLDCNYKSKIEITKEKFIQKSYGSVTLPKGTYNAFKIILGEGCGKNFFCVMFPPMCVGESVSTYVKLNDITTEKEKKILSGNVTYKLKILELIK